MQKSARDLRQSVRVRGLSSFDAPMRRRIFPTSRRREELRSPRNLLRSSSPPPSHRTNRTRPRLHRSKMDEESQDREDQTQASEEETKGAAALTNVALPENARTPHTTRTRRPAFATRLSYRSSLSRSPNNSLKSFNAHHHRHLPSTTPPPPSTKTGPR